jgi:hypothetical protein
MASLVKLWRGKKYRFRGYQLNKINVKPKTRIKMETNQMAGLIISGIAVAGGLGIGAIAILVSVPAAMKEKVLKLEIKHKEKMAMLEKGVDPEIVFKENRGVGQDPMLWGLLLAGMGLGILLGFLLSLITGWDRSVLTNALGVLGSGSGLIAYSFKYKMKNEQ